MRASGRAAFSPPTFLFWSSSARQTPKSVVDRGVIHFGTTDGNLYALQ